MGLTGWFMLIGHIALFIVIRKRIKREVQWLRLENERLRVKEQELSSIVDQLEKELIDE